MEVVIKVQQKKETQKEYAELKTTRNEIKVKDQEKFIKKIQIQHVLKKKLLIVLLDNTMFNYTLLNCVTATKIAILS